MYFYKYLVLITKQHILIKQHEWKNGFKQEKCYR